MHIPEPISHLNPRVLSSFRIFRVRYFRVVPIDWLLTERLGQEESRQLTGQSFASNIIKRVTLIDVEFKDPSGRSIFCRRRSQRREIREKERQKARDVAGLYPTLRRNGYKVYRIVIKRVSRSITEDFFMFTNWSTTRTDSIRVSSCHICGHKNVAPSQFVAKVGFQVENVNARIKWDGI